MADMRKQAGGGPEVQMSAEVARRAQYIRQQLGNGWAGNPDDLDRAAHDEAVRQLQELSDMGVFARDLAARQAQDGPRGSVLRQKMGSESQNAVGTNYDVGALHTAKDLSPWKMFSRATITAIIRAERTRPQTTDSLETLNRLLSIFENLE